MKTAIFQNEAFAELNEAVEYYEAQCTGLGRELRLATELVELSRVSLIKSAV